MNIVKNAIEVWRHYSTGALLAVGGIQAIWAATPQAWIDTLPKWTNQAMAYSTITISILGLIGKFIKQDLPSDYK